MYSETEHFLPYFQSYYELAKDFCKTHKLDSPLVLFSPLYTLISHFLLLGCIILDDYDLGLSLNLIMLSTVWFLRKWERKYSENGKEK